MSKSIITNSMLQRSLVKAHIISRRKSLRPGWNCSRVSLGALDDLDLWVQNRLDETLREHPSQCKTCYVYINHSYRGFGSLDRLLNRSAVRKYVLAKSKRINPIYPFTRVSSALIDALEAHLYARIDSLLQSHPSHGVTFTGK